MKKLAIIGSGDLGQQIAHFAITDNHYQEVVFFDDFATEKEVHSFPIIGTTQSIESAFEKHIFDEILIAIGYKHLAIKKQLFEQLAPKIPFGKMVHSTSWVDPTATIHRGCVIYPGCVIDAHAVIKENTLLNISCSIAHDTIVESHCFLSPRVAVAGFVTIQEQTIIGINATLIDNITIAAKTQIGGGTVVIYSIDKPGLYVGNPAKFIR
jgi:sugar O-acyltransferase (sialic acid O-acetyltransferase NeuD family)